MQDYKLPSPMSWAVYLRRRRLDAAALIRTRELYTYRNLVQFCIEQNVTPPGEREVAVHFVVYVIPRQEPRPVDAPPRQPRRKPVEDDVDQTGERIKERDDSSKM